MKISKIYILFSHLHEGTDYSIFCSTTDAEEVLKECKEFGLTERFEDENDIKLTVETIERLNNIDFGFRDGVRYVLNTLEIGIPEDRVMYGVFLNGNDYCWKAEMIDLFPSKEKAIETVIENLSRKNYDPYEMEEYRNSLRNIDTLTDWDFNYWDIIKIKI